MKNLLILTLCMVMLSCNGFGLRENLPRHDMSFAGYFIRDAQQDYYLFKRNSIEGSEHFNAGDTLTVDGIHYRNVFFAKIVAKNLDKNYRNMVFHPGLPKFIYSRGGFTRKQVPGEGQRQFLVLEKVVGIE